MALSTPGRLPPVSRNRRPSGQIGRLGRLPSAYPFSLHSFPILLFPFLFASRAWVKKKSPKSPGNDPAPDLARKSRESGGSRWETSTPSLSIPCDLRTTDKLSPRRLSVARGHGHGFKRWETKNLPWRPLPKDSLPGEGHPQRAPHRPETGSLDGKPETRGAGENPLNLCASPRHDNLEPLAR